MNWLENEIMRLTNLWRAEHGLAPINAAATHPGTTLPATTGDSSAVDSGSKAAPIDDRERLDALGWPAPGKDYGHSPIYVDSNGELRVSKINHED